MVTKTGTTEDKKVTDVNAIKINYGLKVHMGLGNIPKSAGGVLFHQ